MIETRCIAGGVLAAVLAFSGGIFAAASTTPAVLASGAQPVAGVMGRAQETPVPEPAAGGGVTDHEADPGAGSTPGLVTTPQPVTTPAPAATPRPVSSPVSATTPSASGSTPASPTATPVIAVISDSPGPIKVNGLPGDKTPVTVPLDSEVCIESPVHYAGEADRWTFQHWSTGSSEPCVFLTTPGVYRAHHLHELLLHVKSPISGLQNSRWVVAGTSVSVQVPPMVQTEERIRYRFKEWGAGETPFRPDNTVPVLKPVTAEATWTKQFFVSITGSDGVTVQGTDWYDEGTTITLQAPSEAPGEQTGERLKFSTWETAGVPFLIIPNAQQAATTIKVDAPYHVHARYGKEFFVNVTTPFGTLKRDWMKDGEELPLEAPPLVDTLPEQERFLFQRWEGMEGLFSPKVTGVVSGPLNLRAVYNRQVKVTVIAPYGGSGDGWYAPDSPVTVSVPATVADKLVLKHTFVEFPGYGKTASLAHLVRGPATISAIYRTEVDLGILAMLLALPAVGLILVALHHWMPVLVRFGLVPGPAGQSPAAGPGRTRGTLQAPARASRAAIDAPTQQIPAPQGGERGELLADG